MSSSICRYPRPCRNLRTPRNALSLSAYDRAINLMPKFCNELDQACCLASTEIDDRTISTGMDEQSVECSPIDYLGYVGSSDHGSPGSRATDIVR